MNHKLEKRGLQVLIPFLEAKGYVVERTTGTFDLLVDGKPAEVKTKNKSFNTFDFISLTQNQKTALEKENYDIYLVSNLATEEPEIHKINTRDLKAPSRTINSYEYDRSKLKDAWEKLFASAAEATEGS